MWRICPPPLTSCEIKFFPLFLTPCSPQIIRVFQIDPPIVPPLSAPPPLFRRILYSKLVTLLPLLTFFRGCDLLYCSLPFSRNWLSFVQKHTCGISLTSTRFLPLPYSRLSNSLSEPILGDYLFRAPELFNRSSIERFVAFTWPVSLHPGPFSSLLRN